ncbi:MAG: PD-(D/E)XK nuclease family protein [Litorilinea sp.]
MGALFVLGIGGLLLWRGRKLRAATGLPHGEIVASDTGAWETVDAPLRSRRYGLVGRPDYLVRSRVKGRAMWIPVEVKSARRPRQPAAGHILQLATYCLLVEDVHKTRPAYGLLHYVDVTLEIPYTDALRQAVLDSADAIRKARHAPDVPRTHTVAARCRGCGYRAACGEEAL